MGAVRVLLSEGSSLSARETVTCLGPAGYHLEVLDPDPLCIARFSRWVQRVHRCPAARADPSGYLDAARAVAADRRIDVLLATHEQAWLFAAARPLLEGVPVAVADIASFDRVQPGAPPVPVASSRAALSSAPPSSVSRRVAD